ncbi:hypothetical protein Acsp01_67760 [Actinoplanes sp. NBRC 101535]|nr:hypothetical protein Acsp01_67760 [Actinoplanes sp. NBRC 101535]
MGRAAAGSAAVIQVSCEPRGRGDGTAAMTAMIQFTPPLVRAGPMITVFRLNEAATAYALRAGGLRTPRENYVSQVLRRTSEVAAQRWPSPHVFPALSSVNRMRTAA